MCSALLFYRSLGKELEDYRMNMNPHDMCIANMETSEGNQLAILRHIDNIKISCKSKFQKTRQIGYLKNIYVGKILCTGAVRADTWERS